MPKALDITNRRFGRLVARKIAGHVRGNGGQSYIVWLCDCDCGNQTKVTLANLRRRLGGTKSCGCYKRELQASYPLRHGHACNGRYSRVYGSWRGVIQRCTNLNSRDWNDYGGRGIKVCKRWLKFENFLADMGEPPKGKSLDRYPNNDGDYKKSNCRWATPAEQAVNRRQRRCK